LQTSGFAELATIAMLWSAREDRALSVRYTDQAAALEAAGLSE